MNNEKKLKEQSHPRQKAGFLSVLTFSWTLPTFIKGLRKEFEEEDLFPPLHEHTSSILGDKLEESWIKEKNSQRDPSLLRALVRVFGLELMTYGLMLVFMELVLNMAQPLALSQLLLFYTAKDTKISMNEAYLYASIIVVACFGYALAIHWYTIGVQHFGMKLRVACCSIIYRKSLRLSSSTVGETTIGRMMNLLSNDVNRFDRAALYLHFLWFVPIETAIIIYVLYRIVGPTAAIGVVVMTLFVPLQVYIGRKIANLRLKAAVKTDRRLQLMNEIISGFHMIKMYTWEMQFTKLIALARKLEINDIRAMSYVRGVMLSFSVFTTRLAVFLTIVVYVTLGNDLTAEYVFVIISFYNILKLAVTTYYPTGIVQIGEARVSMTRIQHFLLLDEVDSVRKPTESYRSLNTENDIKFNIMKSGQNNTAPVEIAFQKLSAKWSPNCSKRTLNNINFHTFRGQLTAVVGSVGSGKTSLLLAILKELHIEEGLLIMEGTVSYAAQEPWLFSGTLKQNILFGQPMNQERYRKVINACELEQDLSVLPLGDETTVGERGTILSGGQKARVSLARAIYKEADVYLLDDPLSAVDVHIGRKLFEDCISGFLKHKSVILVTHLLQFLTDVDQIVLMKNGEISSTITHEELKKVNMAIPYEYTSKQTSITKNDKNDYEKISCSKDNHANIQLKEGKAFGTVAGDVYISYFKAGGSILLAIFVLSMFFCTQLFASGTDYFITFWVNAERSKDVGNNTIYEDYFDLPRETSIYIYSGLIATMVIVTLVRSFSLFKYCMKASIELHNNMFSNVIYAPIIFFQKTTSGTILNRFSKDMGAIDDILPNLTIECIQVGLIVIGTTVVIALVNPWMLAVSTIIFIIFYLLRILYLATSRSIKRIEAITRSPILAHMNASLQGLITIRAFGTQKLLQEEFDQHQDLHSSAWYLFLCCTRAFGFWLDLISVIYVGIVTFSFLFIYTESNGGNVGLAITQAISLTGVFQWGMRQWSDLENQMTSVERVSEYTKLKREVVRTDLIPAPNWPGKGNIDFASVSLKYSLAEPYVLKQLKVEIKANEKIGIVGRTGAGKTSLINALFQLTDTEGKIIIDNIDITKVPLDTLRSKISIIPQEPFLFSGTLRRNLDPFEKYDDVQLWNALAEVELKKLIESLPMGLDEKVSEGGSNFSVGQRQLICLARVILGKNKILVMDEATASLDAQTDALIQATIRRKFADCTVLTIAHRLNTVIDSDKILVLDFGSIAEFDRPEVLLSNQNSLFYAMVHQNIASSLESNVKAE